MTWKLKMVGAALCVAALLVPSAEAVIDVGLDLEDSTVLLGNTVDVDIVAQVPEADAILGWGLDLDVVSASIASIVGVNIAAPWQAAATQDGDGLGALSFPPGSSYFGADMVLATVTLQGDLIGISDLEMSDDGPGDITEGFALDPTGLATVVYHPGTIEVIPEPTTLALLAFGGLALLRRR
ncbi:MAG: PEP-CTERM sorting domain-containing protein [bacterium]|nr:PEP-CTERM sorting domain-containing protein [bacterium]